MSLRGIIFKKEKVIISTIEKIGVCSLRTLILKYNNEYDNPMDLWGKKIRKYLIPIRIDSELFTKQGYKLLILRRNPYERIVSGFLDKTIKADCILEVNRKCKEYYKREYSFIEFLKYLQNNKQGLKDNHYKPQSQFYNYHICKRKNYITILDIKETEKINMFLKENKITMEMPKETYLSENYNKSITEKLYDKPRSYFVKNNIIVNNVNVNKKLFYDYEEVKNIINIIYKNDINIF